MTDAEGIAFLQWALPRLHLRWEGFRRMRRQVIRRIDRRRIALGLADVAAYRALLEATPTEWAELDRACRVTVSRFARDRAMWLDLAGRVLPGLARATSTVRAWSAGCGAGEEPYTLSIAWELAVDAPGVALEILATDADDVQLARAAMGRYEPGTLRELPAEWRAAAFDGDRLRDRFRARVRFEHHDVRTVPPGGPFELILCRNLAFTYFDEVVQRGVAEKLRSALAPGGVLVAGAGEHVPE